MVDSQHPSEDQPEQPPMAKRIEQLQAQIRGMKSRSVSNHEDVAEPLPETIGLYEILSVLGEGGMGTVYLAEQQEPVRRRVALKVIKLGMDSKQVLHRFGAERQALAMMEHSNIAKVFEAGTTDRGQPFFVMEYVSGMPITEHCDQHNLSIEERIGLFRQICSGVQHAHQKGVMHRDLKPSNVLVSMQEGEAIPKIIDFGLARATDHQLIQATLYTEKGLILGTPEYMSPEQAGMGGQDIDTRTDVYSLGVLLYELLVGELPFTQVELRQVGLGEMQRKIMEDEPPKPSTRLLIQGKASEHAARRRHTDTRSLLRRMRGDLDWIVMRAIEKDRTRRYETPAALADDLKRHLEFEPVLAGPPSAGYRLKKLARKYRIQVTAATLVLLALVAGIIGTSVGFAKAKAAEAEATSEAKRATTAEEETRLRAAELAQVVAFQEAQISEIDPEKMGIDLRKSMIAAARAAMEGSKLSTDIIDERQAIIEEVLQGMNFTNLALDTLEANIFTRALAAIDEKFADQPLVMARLLQAEADVLRNLGLLESANDPQSRAMAIRRRELGDDHLDTLSSINGMGLLLQDQGKFLESEPYLREALEGNRRVLGDDHPRTLVAINNMGGLLSAQGKLSESEPYYVEALAGLRSVLDKDHPDTLAAINNLGLLFLDQGKSSESESYLLEALDGFRRTLGDDHPTTLIAINNLGLLFLNQGKSSESEPYLREALDGFRRVRGDDHPTTLAAILSMGSLLQAQGRLAAAEPYYVEALDGFRDVLGDDHPSTLTSIQNMGKLLQAQGKLAEAESYWREALEGRRLLHGDDHPDTLISINSMGMLLYIQNKFFEVEPYWREALDGRRRVLGDDHPSTLTSIQNMGHLLQAQGKLAEAETYLREALEGHRRVLGEAHHDTANSLGSLASLLETQGDYAALVILYEGWDKLEEAAKWRKKLSSKK